MNISDGLYKVLDYALSVFRVVAAPTEGRALQYAASEVSIKTINADPVLSHATDGFSSIIQAANSLHESGLVLEKDFNLRNLVNAVFDMDGAMMHAEFGSQQFVKAAKHVAMHGKGVGCPP